jgi:hypothetical protein
MSQNKFPPLIPAGLNPTHNTIRGYAQVLGKIRRALTPRQKHWWHVSLRLTATGLTTTPIPAGDFTFEMRLDFTTHQLVIKTSRGDEYRQPLRGQSVAVFCEDTLAALARFGIAPEIDRSLFTDTTPGTYNPTVAAQYWQALSQMDIVFKQFKGELRQETGPVQLWPHHMDLALLWFSGRLVPDQDPDDEEYSDEQMNFGFSPGDEGIPEPYFYITAYPTPDGFADTPLPEDAYWHTTGFTGAILKYTSLVDADAPAEKLLTYLRTVQQAGASLMQ